MRTVIALGGNAILQKGQALESEIQANNIARAARNIADIVTNDELAITHGNGPQVGLLALQAEGYPEVTPYPFDILDAESAGMLGYLISLHMDNALPTRQSVALITRVLVDPEDPAFARATKPVGPVYPTAQGDAIARQRGWQMTRISEGMRRVVPSPRPQKIIELSAIEVLLTQGAIVVCCGGGGIPVVQAPNGGLVGVAAVIDKDASSALLASALEADRLIMLTDVEAVYKNWNTDSAKPIQRMSTAELRELEFEEGSMAPKVAAACQFADETGNSAYIGKLTRLPDIIRGLSGTRIDAG
ncbi:MAG TPA: carbamate kinase [Porticoccaceae bacterium]|nr:carbamate kinase [Porticoccaceae bacterium]